MKYFSGLLCFASLFPYNGGLSTGKLAAPNCLSFPEAKPLRVSVDVSPPTLDVQVSAQEYNPILVQHI